jgi:hypothetical protein
MSIIFFFSAVLCYYNNLIKNYRIIVISLLYSNFTFMSFTYYFLMIHIPTLSHFISDISNLTCVLSLHLDFSSILQLYTFSIRQSCLSFIFFFRLDVGLHSNILVSPYIFCLPFLNYSIYSFSFLIIY